MPYKSKAQARKFHVLEKEGKISAETVNEFDKSTNFSKLPDRAKTPIRAARKPRKG